MTKHVIPALLLIATLVLSTACNPECETLPATNVNLPPGPYEKGTELAITSMPPDLIKGRDISVSLRTQNSTTTLSLRSRFEEEMGATIVELPDEINSSAQFFIDDPDCTGGQIPIGTASSLVDAGFFKDNPFFITPIPPLIIIPTVPVSPPVQIINAWFSPNNRDYCIWFKPDFDDFGQEKPVLVPGVVTSLNDFIPPAADDGGSLELAANCSNVGANVDRLYHANPVSGIVDKANNYIRIRIDRTLRGLGIEEMEGQFVDPATLPAEYITGGVCNPDNSQKPNIMLLTSLQTGRQLILFRGAD